MSDVRFGLIGFGLFGAHHARAIAGARNASLAAIAVKSEASREAARREFPDVDVVADYHQLLQRPDIELIDVVLPNRLHFSAGMAALQAGKHLLMEKPLALALDECDQLVQAAAERQLLLAVGHELRLSSLWGGAKRLIEEGAIGRVQHVLIELSRFPYRQGAEGWRYDIQRVGSWILEEPIHFFDLAQWYLSHSGSPTSIYARANSRHDDQPELRDNFSAIVNFADGAYAVISQTLAAFGHHQSAKIAGTLGAMWVHWSASDARSEQPTFGLQWGLGDQVQEMGFSDPTGELLELSDEIEAVAQCVRRGGQPPCSGEEGRWSARLCLAAEESVRTARPINIDEFLRDDDAPAT